MYMYELLGEFIVFTVMAWLVLPIILGLINVALAIVIALLTFLGKITPTCSSLETTCNTRASFNGYTPKDRNHRRLPK